MAQRQVFLCLWSVSSYLSMNFIGKGMILKNALKKRFSWQNLWHIVSFCTWRSDDWPPISPVISKHALFGVQSAWAAAYLADPMPSVHWGAVSLTKCRYNLPSPELPSSSLMEFYVSQMVCVCIYSLYKIVHYTCNVEYTTRCACPAFRLVSTFAGP